MKIQFKDKLEIYEQNFFTYDAPVPFKGDLMIYPAVVKDYYLFYSLISCFTIDKDEDPNGEGFGLTDLQYLFLLMRKDKELNFRNKFVNLLELVFHIENGLYCDNEKCEHSHEVYSYKQIRQMVGQVVQELDNKYKDIENGEMLKQKEKQQKMYELQLCPHCHKVMRDVIEFEEEEGKLPQIHIKGTVINNGEFKELKRLYCYQNLPDFNDEYMDADLKKELEMATKLKSGNTEQPTLERQMSCIVVSSGLSYKEIEQLTIRKFTSLLRVADAKLNYLAYKVGEMSGLVTFKTPFPHWIYTKENARQSMLDNIMTFDQVQSKIGDGGVTT